MLMIATGVLPPRDCGPGCDREIRRIWGCKEATSQFPTPVERDDGSVELVRRCPWALVREAGAWGVLRHWNHYRRGFLPCAGGIEDQPGKLLEAIEFIDAHIEDYRRQAEGLSDGDQD